VRGEKESLQSRLHSAASGSASTTVHLEQVSHLRPSPLANHPIRRTALGFRFHGDEVEGSRASPPPITREGSLTHPADPSRSNLLTPWVCFRGGGFQTLTSVRWVSQARAAAAAAEEKVKQLEHTCAQQLHNTALLADKLRRADGKAELLDDKVLASHPRRFP
jgi:hypothetical protein